MSGNIYNNILVPELTNSEYGKNLEEQFENINSNFQKLANYDFHKGRDAEGVLSVSIDLNFYNTFIKNGCEIKSVDDIYSILYGNGIRLTAKDNKNNYKDFPENLNITQSYIIRKVMNDDLAKEIVEVWKTEFTNPEIIDGVIHTSNDLIFSVTLSDESTTIIDVLKSYLLGVGPYVYMDEDFYNKQKNDYLDENKIDNTGIYISPNNSIIGVTNEDILKYFPYINFTHIKSFPTIYFNGEKFCWQFGNHKTNLPCQGPQGKDGADGEILIVKVDTNSNDTNDITKTVKSIYSNIPDKESSHWLAPKDWLIENKKIDDLNWFNSKTCIVITQQTEDNTENESSESNIGIVSSSYWISQLYVNDDNEVNVNLTDDTKITQSVSEDWFLETMKGLNKIENNRPAGINKGLFIPYEHDKDLYGHMLYGETNEEKPNTSDRKALHLSPIAVSKNMGFPNNESIDESATFTIDYNNTTINGNLKVNEIEAESLTTTGNTTINGNLKANEIEAESLTTTGGVTINGDLNTKAIEAESLTTTGDTTIGGKLKVNEIERNSGNAVNISNISSENIITDFFSITNGTAGQLLMANGEITKNNPIKVDLGNQSIDCSYNSNYNQIYIPLKGLFKTSYITIERPNNDESSLCFHKTLLSSVSFEKYMYNNAWPGGYQYVNNNDKILIYAKTNGLITQVDIQFSFQNNGDGLRYKKNNNYNATWHAGSDGVELDKTLLAKFKCRGLSLPMTSTHNALGSTSGLIVMLNNIGNGYIGIYVSNARDAHDSIHLNGYHNFTFINEIQ